MFQKTEVELKSKTHPTTNSDAVIKLKDWLHPLLLTLAKSKIKYNMELLNDRSTIPDHFATLLQVDIGFHFPYN